ncbi:MAG: phosphate ABC transporter permease subunit PstC [Saprospiraceae bacterium]|nr:phosphate ABC transporter permease subunit PstC [Saprospiraceae bacterium]
MEGLIRISGYSSAIIIILIVFFLFREGISFLNMSPVEEGYSLIVNRNNPIHTLTAGEIKNIFDGKEVNWNHVGGTDQPIHLLTLDELVLAYPTVEFEKRLEEIPVYIDLYLDSLVGVIGYFPTTLIQDKTRWAKSVQVPDIDLQEFILGDEWFPTAVPAAQMGIMPLLLGTLLVAFAAILFSLPLGLAAAIYLAEIADERVRMVLKPVIELLAGIPSVVYGFFGLVIIVPFVQTTFGLPVGETALAGSLVLAIMALPTIITVSEDSLRTTPRVMKEASLALGASRWQTIRKVVIPYASSGITAAAILGIGRAIGETMAVLMVTGNSAIIPRSLLQPVRTIPATIAAELGEAPFGGLHFKALFALGCMLFIMTLLINLGVERVSHQRKH